MHREKIVTIIIGLVVGALLAGLFYFGPNLISKTNQPQEKAQAPTQAPKTSPLPTVMTETKMSVDSPENNSSTTEGEIMIRGTATPNSKIVVFANSDEGIASASSNGKFEKSVKLEEGENVISVTALTDPPQTITRNVILEIAE